MFPQGRVLVSIPSRHWWVGRTCLFPSTEHPFQFMHVDSRSPAWGQMLFFGISKGENSVPLSELLNSWDCRCGPGASLSKPRFLFVRASHPGTVGTHPADGWTWTRTHNNLPLGVIPASLSLHEQKYRKQKHSEMCSPTNIKTATQQWSGTCICYLHSPG